MFCRSSRSITVKEFICHTIKQGSTNHENIKRVSSINPHLVYKKQGINITINPILHGRYVCSLKHLLITTPTVITGVA